MSLLIKKKIIKPNPVIKKKKKRRRGILAPLPMFPMSNENNFSEYWSSDMNDMSYYSNQWNMNSIMENINMIPVPQQQQYLRFNQGIQQNNTDYRNKMNRGMTSSQIDLKQTRLLMQHMRGHHNFALGIILKGELETKKYHEMWETLRSKLNSCGPPKSTNQWKTTWRQMRTNARKRNKKMLESNAKGKTMTCSNLDKDIFAIITKNLTMSIENKRAVSHPVAPPPPCIVIEDDEETNPDDDFGINSFLEVGNSVSNSFLGEIPQVTQVGSLAVKPMTELSQRSYQYYPNISDGREDKAYLDLMSETNKGLEAISKSIENLAKAQNELQKIELDRNAIFGNCLSVLKNGLNMNSMPQSKQERTLNEYDVLE